MHSNAILIDLRHEKAILEQVLELAECQLELIQSGRIEDVEILLRLRAEPMIQLANAEVNVGREMPQLEHDDLNMTTTELEELQRLNLLITNLATRIADIDDRVNRLAELQNSAWPAAQIEPH
ncbi:MAG TPA: hypothetical protein VE422_30105 [Terriglobia bacterium]|nr:hypothetical protein [Terriglobia bacterium]